MSQELDRELDGVFAAARRAFPDEIEPSPEFMPSIWRRIEETRTVSWLAVLRRWSPRFVAAASAATAALVLAIVLGQGPADSGADVLEAAYVDVLTVDSLDEQDGVLWTLAAR